MKGTDAIKNRRKKRYWYVIILVVSVAVCAPLIVAADEHDGHTDRERNTPLHDEVDKGPEPNGDDAVHQEWQRLNELAQEALSLVEKKDYAAARNRIQNVAESYMQLEPGQYVEHIEQAQLLLETIVEAKQALTAVDMDDQQVQRKVLKVRLTLHAVSHEEAPLWLDYFEPIEKIIVDLQHTIEEGERDQFYNHLNRLAVYYELVRPSIAVSHPPRMYVQLDSQMAYFFNERAKLWSDKEHTAEMLQSLHRQMRVAFFMENNDQLSFWLLLLGLGTFICTILAYVGWKKYTGEQKKETVSWRELNRK